MVRSAGTSYNFRFFYYSLFFTIYLMLIMALEYPLFFGTSIFFYYFLLFRLIKLRQVYATWLHSDKETTHGELS